MLSSNSFICVLPLVIQRKISMTLFNALIPISPSKKELLESHERGMSSRLDNLSDTIDIEPFKEMLNEYNKTVN